MQHAIRVGEGEDARTIAALSRPGAAPIVVWLGGLRSDMRATKAEALDSWASRTGRAFLRFDYSGHGESGGRFEDGTISRWLEDAAAALADRQATRPILVGSSLGGWLALLLARHLRREAPDRAPAGLVLVAPAVDFTERLMWDCFPEAVRAEIIERGVYLRPSLYSEDPYPITRALIEDGRRHLLLESAIEIGCPVHVLQGMCDPDVPWEHALRLVEHLPGEGVQLTLVKDGDHRLSRPEDLDRLVRAVERMAVSSG